MGSKGNFKLNLFTALKINWRYLNRYSAFVIYPAFKIFILRFILRRLKVYGFFIGLAVFPCGNEVNKTRHQCEAKNKNYYFLITHPVISLSLYSLWLISNRLLFFYFAPLLQSKKILINFFAKDF